MVSVYRAAPVCEEPLHFHSQEFRVLSNIFHFPQGNKPSQDQCYGCIRKVGGVADLDTQT